MNVMSECCHAKLEYGHGSWLREDDLLLGLDCV